MTTIIRHRPTCSQVLETERWAKLGASHPSWHDVACDCGAQPAPVVRADCGHETTRALLMAASTGTACPDCYDRMS